MLWIFYKIISGKNIMHRIVLLTALIAAYSATTHAEDCHVVESADKVEIVCEGTVTPETPAADKKPATAPAKPDEKKSESAPLPLQKASENIGINNLSVITLSRKYGSVNFSIKGDIENKNDFDATIYIVISGKTSDGYEVGKLTLYGFVAKGQKKTLSVGGYMAEDLASKVATWESTLITVKP
jgi:hypothetical protein